MLDVDPDLGSGLRPDQFKQARQLLVARAVQLSSGRCAEFGSASPYVAYLLVEGALLRELHLGGRTSVELLGPGDLVRPSAAFPTEAARPDETWFTLDPILAAALESRFFLQLQEFPSIYLTLMDRLFIRAKSLGFQVSVCSLPRIDRRLMLMFRLLADRWGTVTPAGIRIPLALSHATLAALVGARRPATTTALGHLIERGLIERRDDGNWILMGPPSAEPQAVLDSMTVELTQTESV